MEAVKEEERNVSFFFRLLLRLLLIDLHSPASVLRLRLLHLMTYALVAKYLPFLKLCQLIEQHKTHVMSEKKLGNCIRD